MLKNPIIFLTAILVLLVVACSENPTNPNNERVEAGENYTFILSAKQAENAENNRSELISDPFLIDDVRIEIVDDTKLMFIEVTQELGCAESHPDKFQVIWDGIMLMIYPPQVAFYLTFNSDVCTEVNEGVQETIVLDLHKHVGDYGESAQYTVINASKSAEDNDIKISR